jgi:hypothetical protein
MRPNSAVLAWYDGTASRVRIAQMIPPLTGLLVNADINASAAIAWSKINPSGAELDDLDDYEEGTWAPDLRFGGNASGMTYMTQSGTYTRVGRMYTCLAVIRLSAKGSSTGAATLTGLPATVASAPNHGAISCSYFDQFSAGVSDVGGYCNGSTTSIVLMAPGAGSVIALDDTNFTNATGFVLVATFFV